VGFNPYRRFKAQPVDYLLVAVCIAVAVALLAWAVFG
jgi:energy-coupling factor transporter transmembrane protein EcfT